MIHSIFTPLDKRKISYINSDRQSIVDKINKRNIARYGPICTTCKFFKRSCTCTK